VIPHHHIDLGTVLRGAVCALYSNLVTRPTGAAVRTEIERVIAESGGRTVTVIDFSQVTLLDFSCADEIVAKLMLRYCAPLAPTISAEAGPRPATSSSAGCAITTWTPVEAVLERHGPGHRGPHRRPAAGGGRGGRGGAPGVDALQPPGAGRHGDARRAPGRRGGPPARRRSSGSPAGAW
jgi:hypothetical protein